MGLAPTACAFSGGTAFLSGPSVADPTGTSNFVVTAPKP
jgi:hypothetical protein